MNTSPRPIVIKLGGAEGVDHARALDDIAQLRQSGRPLVIVHGGSAEADRLGRDLGHPPTTLTSPSGHSSRYTDPRTLEVFVMATALVNRRLVGALQAQGTQASGLSGLDGALLRGQRKPAIRAVENGRVRVIRDDWSGRIEAVAPAVLQALMSSGITPVVAPLAMTPKGQPLNVDGDRAAAAIAVALQAEALVLLTGAAGLYRAYPDASTRIESASLDQMGDLMDYAEGRMKRKVLAAGEALEGGVTRVVIATANSDRPVLDALAGKGTTLHAAADCEALAP